MNKISQRSPEIKVLDSLWRSPQAEFLAIYGRRRVGKTFLIEQYFKKIPTFFSFTGQRKTTTRVQVKNLSVKLKGYFPQQEFAPIKDWSDFFIELKKCITSHDNISHQKKVIFFDELPWLCPKNSGFKEAMEYFWNDWASKKEFILLIICGSAASWMLDNVVRDKGGLHNRVTKKIHLKPFDLAQTKGFLGDKGIQLDMKQILELYMVMGGVPFYLNNIQSGLSSSQIIDQLCFNTEGFLYGEFENLYASLFDKPEKYTDVIRALAKSRKGITRNDISRIAKLPSGGTLSKIIMALEECGFIASYSPLGKKSKDSLYRLTDEYTLFYLTFIEPKYNEIRSFSFTDLWLKEQKEARWKAWSAYSFESICIKHAKQIHIALGISGIMTKVQSWTCASGKTTKGAQIDMVIDRSDNSINIIEAKYSSSPYAVSKKDVESIRNKLMRFQEVTKTNKTLFVTFISTYGCTENQHFLNIAHHNLRMDCLFE